MYPGTQPLQVLGEVAAARTKHIATRTTPPAGRMSAGAVDASARTRSTSLVAGDGDDEQRHRRTRAEKARVSPTTPGPKWRVAATAVIAARTGPAHGTKSGPSPIPRTKPLVVPRGGRARRWVKGRSMRRAERRHEQAEPDEAEDDESGVAQQVLWQVERAEQRRTGERERGEAEDEAGDDGDGTPAAPAPGVRRDRRRPGDEDDRQDRQDARRDPGDQPGDEPDHEQCQHSAFPPGRIAHQFCRRVPPSEPRPGPRVGR